MPCIFLSLFSCAEHEQILALFSRQHLKTTVEPLPQCPPVTSSIYILFYGYEKQPIKPPHTVVLDHPRPRIVTRSRNQLDRIVRSSLGHDYRRHGNAAAREI